MSSVELRTVKRRIGSTRHIAKVTSALQQVAAARLAREKRNVAACSRYTEHITSLLTGIVRSGGAISHPYLKPAASTGVCFVVMGSDRGLCGGYNSVLMDRLSAALESEPGRDNVSVIVTGAVPRRRCSKMGLNILASFQQPEHERREEYLDQLSAAVNKGFASGTFGRVALIYTHYRSPLDKNPVLIDLLPLSSLKPYSAASSASLLDAFPFNSALYDPAPDSVMDFLVPEVIRQLLNYAFLHSICSEDAFRQESMMRASDNADAMLRDLMLSFSRLRQESITTEMLEIAASGFAGRGNRH